MNHTFDSAGYNVMALNTDVIEAKYNPIFEQS